MTKKQENELQERLKMYDGAAKLIATALSMYYSGEIEKREDPVLYIRSHGRALYAIVCEKSDATLSAHSNCYPLWEVVGDAHGDEPWLKWDAICKLAIEWVFGYMQGKDLYDFSAELGRIEYFAKWVEHAIEKMPDRYNGVKDSGIYIQSSRKNRFFISYGVKGAVKETARIRFYPDVLFYDVDENMGVLEVSQTLLYRIAAEWVLGILK